MDIENIRSRGDVVERILPCGSTILLREQNGQDEAVLSNEAESLSGLAIRKFISRVVMAIKKPGEENFSHCSLNMVNSLKSRSVYYILLLSRVHSLGSDMILKKTFTGPNKAKKEETLALDLSTYLRDFSKTPDSFPKPDEPGYDPHQCAPYTDSSEYFYHSFPASGKEIRFKYMTHGDEFAELDSSLVVDVNLKLRFRKVEWKKTGDKDWKEAQTFEMFTSKEMREIRKILNESDPEFNILASALNPLTGQEETFTLIGEPDFFFPVD